MICYTSEESDATLFLSHPPGRDGRGRRGVVMKDGSGVAEKVEKTSATDAADADLIEERAAFEQRPKEGERGRREGGKGDARSRRGRTRRR